MRARYVSVGGLRTRILEGGSGGVPLFLLHAVGLTADTWIRNIDALAERRLVIAPDMPGHGFTDASPGYTDAPQLFWARHLLALADALGFDRFHVAGSSFSGLVAVLIALAAPERTESLTVVGSGTVFHEADGRERALRSAFANGSRAITEASIEACRTRLQGICHAADSVDERILLAQASAYAQPDRLVAYKQVIEGAIASGREAQALHRLEAIDAPTLIITGRQDVRASVASHVAGAARIPGALLHVYDACGHLPYLEHSDRFNKDLGGFLEALRTNRPRIRCMLKRVPLCAKTDVPTDKALQVRIPGGEALAVCQAEGSFYVVADTCSHGLASLSEGEIVGSEIYCPFHGGAFDIRTGKATERPCTVAIATYPVVEEGGTLFIEVAE